MSRPPEHPASGTNLADDATQAGLADHDALIQRHKRVVLGAAAVTVVIAMAFPILTSFTGVLDGVANGVGAGYAAGLAVILLPLFGAVAYRRWTSRVEERGRR